MKTRKAKKFEYQWISLNVNHWLLILTLVLLAGCLTPAQNSLDEESEQAVEPTEIPDEPVLLARTDSSTTNFVLIQPPEDCTNPNPPYPNAIVRNPHRLVPEGAYRIVGIMDVNGLSTGYRIGVSFEGGDIVWSGSTHEGPVSIEVPVLPGQGEDRANRWSFYKQLNIEESEMECSSGATVYDFEWAFYALPPGAEAPNL